jgi:5-methylcytosine-specific restriction enzyme subunit McrC
MNLLFEAYVVALARKACAPLGYKVSAQGPQRCLARNEAGRSVFHTKPDVHLERDGDIVVLDTKWKHIDPSRPNFDVAQADAYQMHGYAHVYESRATILLYPHHPGIIGRPGLQMQWSFEAGGTPFILATIDVATPEDFATTLRWLLKESVTA